MRAFRVVAGTEMNGRVPSEKKLRQPFFLISLFTGERLRGTGLEPCS